MNRGIKLLLCLLVFSLLASVFSIPRWLQAQAIAQTKTAAPTEDYHDAKSAYWHELRQYVQDAHEAHVGMTRNELTKTFHMETGLTQGHTWVYNQCPFIRMNVTFNNQDGIPSFDPADRVTALGSPYWDNHIESPN